LAKCAARIRRLTSTPFAPENGPALRYSTLRSHRTSVIGFRAVEPIVLRARNPSERTGGAVGWRAMHTTRRTLLLLGLAAPAAAAGAAITGTATCRERIALRPGAVLEVDLHDISRADAPSEPIAAARIPVSGQVPIPFSLPHDPTRVTPRGRYAVRARLLYGDQVAFRSDTVHPVLSMGGGRTVEILLVRARDGAAVPGAGPVGPLWLAEDIGGRGVVDRLQTTLTLDPAGRAFGSGGCNRFTGGYVLDGATLRFQQMASTQMACVPAAMDQERRFHAALAEVRGWRMENGLLHLTGEAGATVVRLSRAG
jgi:putative lipoprotein